MRGSVGGAAIGSEPDWREGVRVREDPELARSIAARLPAEGRARDVAVTDLLAPRRAYWRAVAPVPAGPEREERMDHGRDLHRRLGVALAPEGSLEVRVRRDGVVGRIDVMSDLPVEVKTTARPVSIDAWAGDRPDQVEQLALYAVLTGRTAGRLVSLDTSDPSAPRVLAWEATFGPLDRTRAAMVRLGESLRRAWRERDPGELPPCRWFGRGCEYQTAGACDCVTGLRPSDSPLDVAVNSVRSRDDLAARIVARLPPAPGPEADPALERFRDLLFPRRAYFERTTPTPPGEPPRFDPGSPPDLYDRVRYAMECGPLGEVARLPTRTEDPEEDVGAFRGLPFLVRMSRAWDAARAASLIDRQPQYALELGLRCVATGTSTARLILGRERAARDEDRVQVFEFGYERPSGLSRWWRARARALSSAISERAPDRLPPCPDWMYANCPYRPECACAAEPGRSQR